MSQPDEGLPAGAALKRAAVELEREVLERVRSRQGGVPTFFDNFLLRTVARLRALDLARPWEESVARLGGPEGAQLGQALLRLRRYLARRRDGRFADYAARLVAADGRAMPRSEVDGATFAMSQGTAGPLEWRGLPLFKTAFDLALYALLLWELKPRTVIELGSGSGASALWLADHLRLFGVDGRVISVDLRAPALSDPAVSFLAGDCRRLAETLPAERLAGLAHPLLVVEDAHVAIPEVLEHLHGALRTGDYLAVEDSTAKTADLTGFLERHPEAYKVDTRYTDCFGRNATSCSNSIFVRL